MPPALDFPNPPLTVGQTYAGTNGITYTWDGTVWTVPQGGTDLWVISGSTITPVDATKRVNVPGPMASGADQSQIQLGTRTMKGRLQSLPGVDWFGLVFNRFYNGTAWAQEDATKASWDLQMGGSDGFTIERQAPAGAPATLLNLDSAGNLNLAGSGEERLVLGSATMKSRVVSSDAASFAGLMYNVNWNGSAFVRDDTSKSAINLYAQSQVGNQTLVLQYTSAAGAASTAFTIDGGSNLVIAGTIGQKASGTTWSNPSDPRLKQDVAPYAAGLAEIARLEPITYRLKAQPDALCYGFDAEKVRDVFPECVTETRMKLDPADEEDTDGVLLFDMHPVLIAFVNALKEMATRLAALEAR